MPRILVFAVAAGLLAALVGCSAGGTTEPPGRYAEPASSTTAPPAIQVPTVDSSDAVLRADLATRVLEVGDQRVAFLLSTQTALVKAPSVTVTISGQDGAVEPAEITAVFNEWPYGVRGSYTAVVPFPSAGNYVLTAAVADDTVSGSVEIPVSVVVDSPVPALGDPIPPSKTKTLSDGLELTQLTTAYQPDPELYAVSIGDAVAEEQPAVIVFATPAFCTSPTCGPQVDTVSELRAAHPDDANFIHVELYDNPAEIQGDLSKARLVDTADEWGFTRLEHWTNESWVFVADGQGIVRHRFEGFATFNELEAALRDVTGP